MTAHDYTVRVNQDDDGSLWAEVAELPGCFASGDSLDELRDSLEDAIALYVGDGTGSAEPDPGGSARPRAARLIVGEMKVTIPI